MKTADVKLYPSLYYHIYNRGNNGENIFYEKQNYIHFLRTWAKYLEPVAETYAYCLLRNHFHCLVRIRDLSTIIRTVKPTASNAKMAQIHKDPARFISYQFGHCFNSYAQSMNKRYHRTGTFFEERFERIHIDNPVYYHRLIQYIHRNPEKHNFMNNYKDYPYSSYNSYLSVKPTLLMRDAVLSLFGGANEYEDYHASQQDEKEIKRYWIEKDDI